MTARRRSAPRTGHAVCTFCGCTCDDIGLRVARGKIVEAQRACSLGADWFRDRSAPPASAKAYVEGRAAEPDDAIEAAAGILAAARLPLIYGLVEASGEAQAAAAELGDLLGATLDTATSASQIPWLTAFQRRGVRAATLGEVKNRADLLVLWQVAPEDSHPRFFDRFVRPQGLYVSGQRRIIALGEGGAVMSGEAQQTLRIPDGRALEALWALRAIVQGRPLGADAEQSLGLPQARLEGWAGELTTCRYGVWVYDADRWPGPNGVAQAQAALALVEALNERVPFAALGLRGRGNPVGAENVVTSRAGYPFSVNFARGYPRFGPRESAAAEVLARGEADAVLIVGCDPEEHLPEPAWRALDSLPAAVVDFRDSARLRRARAGILTATYGVSAAATVTRMDGIVLRARPALESALPSDAEVLRQTIERVGSMRSGGGRP